MHKKTAVTAALCLLAAAFLIFAAGCVGSDQTPAAKEGDTVSVFYTLTVDGVEKESNFGSTPLEFTIGAGSMIKGFNDGVIGMKTGETKTIEVSPENGYGVYSKEKKTELPLSDLKEAFGTVSVGDIVEVYAGYTKMNAEILSIDENNDTAEAAVNHPLAGKTLTFTIKLDSITPAK
ncbi:MAG: FKBP-type peptidyl-prolyl cis-trans isomerase [Methanocorpusculum sp.]|nr:FKBP-type peptidyl-prolyl cis-trans isomerase [Methanocorpusculum sp.]